MDDSLARTPEGIDAPTDGARDRLPDAWRS